MICDSRLTGVLSAIPFGVSPQISIFGRGLSKNLALDELVKLDIHRIVLKINPEKRPSILDLLFQIIATGFCEGAGDNCVHYNSGRVQDLKILLVAKLVQDIAAYFSRLEDVPS